MSQIRSAAPQTQSTGEPNTKSHSKVTTIPIIDLAHPKQVLAIVPTIVSAAFGGGAASATTGACGAGGSVASCQLGTQKALPGTGQAASSGPSDPTPSTQAGGAGGSISPPANTAAAAGQCEPDGADGNSGAADGTSRVGRWMGDAELSQMRDSGKVIEGSGGRTYVGTTPSASDYKPGAGNYVEFDVPTNSLRAAGQPNWAQIPGPNVGTTRFGAIPCEMPPATNIKVVDQR